MAKGRKPQDSTREVFRKKMLGQAADIKLAMGVPVIESDDGKDIWFCCESNWFRFGKEGNDSWVTYLINAQMNDTEVSVSYDATTTHPYLPVSIVPTTSRYTLD
jgi:hypothetical protein